MTYLTTEQHAEIQQAFRMLTELSPPREGDSPAPTAPEEIERLMLEMFLESFPKNVAWIQQQTHLHKRLTREVSILKQALYDLHEHFEPTGMNDPDETQAWVTKLVGVEGGYYDGMLTRLNAILKELRS